MTEIIVSLISLLGIIIPIHYKYKKRNIVPLEVLQFEKELDKLVENTYKKNWKCINEYKTTVAKDIIRIKVKVIKKNIANWCIIHNNDKDLSKSVDSFSEMINCTFREYIREWKDVGINQIIINSLINANSSYGDSAVNLGVNELNKKYNDTTTTLNHLMNSLLIPCKASIIGTRNLMDSFNGELKDDVYKGVKNSNEYIPLSKRNSNTESFIDGDKYE